MDKNAAAGHGGGDRNGQFPVANEEEDEWGDLYEDIHFSGEFQQWRRENEALIAQRNEQAPPEVVPTAVERRNQDEGPSSRVPTNMPNINNVGNVGTPSGNGGGGTILFVGELQWWTTDAELDSELSKYGPVKDVHFFTNLDNGKSLGYCHVEFYDGAAATACKEGMNGHKFNGRSCVVEHAAVERIGDAQVTGNQQQGSAETNVNQPPRDRPPRPGTTVGRGFGRGNWGGGRGNRVPIGPSMMRGGAGGSGIRGFMGHGNQSGQGSDLGGQTIVMGQGFDPGFGGLMGIFSHFGGAPSATFPGMLASGGCGFPQVLPPFSPLFFGMGGWAGEKYGGRGGERERNVVKEKAEGPERLYQDEREAGYGRDPRKGKGIAGDHGDQRDVRERRKDYHVRGGERSLAQLGRHHGRERDHERDRNGDQPRNRNRDEYDDGSSRSHRISRSLHEEERRSRSRGADHDHCLDHDRDRRRHGRDRNVDQTRNRNREEADLEAEHRSKSRDADYGKKHQ